MPFLAPIIFPPLLFEDDDFCRSALLDDGGADRGAGEQRGTGRDLGAVADHQHFAELDDGAGFAGQFLDRNNVVLGDLVLFAAGSDHCKHNLCRNGLPRFGRQSRGRSNAADKSLVRGRRTIRPETALSTSPRALPTADQAASTRTSSASSRARTRRPSSSRIAAPSRASILTPLTSTEPLAGTR